MAGYSNFEDEEGITGINVTPLVDVMLVLLVIFMVTANYIAHQALNLELPKASTGQDPGETNLNFTLDKNSNLFVDGKPVLLKDAGRVIRNRLRERAALSALISADKSTPHGSVVRLMDLIKSSGVSNIAFNVEFDPNGLVE